MNRYVLNVATRRFRPGQQRLVSRLNELGESSIVWDDNLPPGSPPHWQVPFAFKAFALEFARTNLKADMVLWADASVFPIRAMDPLWEHIEENGYWISRNGWSNGQWCCDAALEPLGMTREEAFEQEHVVATAFGLDFRHRIARECFAEYFRLASETKAFCGPLKNDNGEASSDKRVLGHRHDQTSLSTIAHRLRMELTSAPRFFAYKGGEMADTVLLAHGIC